MRLRTFTAPDMPTALKMVRDAMGDNAVILSSEQQRGKKGITVVAAQEGEDEPIFPTHAESRLAPAPEKTISSAAAERIRAELQAVLRFHNLPESFLPRIFGKADPRELASIEALHALGPRQDTGSFVRLALEKTVGQFFEFDPLDFAHHSPHFLLVGPPGMGKTLTAAKIAAAVTLRKRPLVVFTTDNKRAGGVQQLQAFTDILGIELKTAASPLDLGKQLKAVPMGVQALIDTAGGNPYDPADMKEISQMAHLPGVEPILVQACGGDSMEAIDIGEAFAKLPIRRLLITRVDTARRLGGVLSVAAAHKLAFAGLSASASAVEGLQPMDGPGLTRLLLRYQLQTS